MATTESRSGGVKAIEPQGKESAATPEGGSFPIEDAPKSRAPSDAGRVAKDQVRPDFWINKSAPRSTPGRRASSRRRRPITTAAAVPGILGT